ncbi:hypothetical protein RIF29_22159 [Crotalaria pallida]|uniref:Uncharacterized protein n=1 Tax=Crotalaria pallida TaxID=3830 RepID=A0AAN9FCV6_CROPI
MEPLVAETMKKKAMWLYPKVLGFNPSERWGHSACFSNGLMYVFGGCCGGMHFSDIQCLDLEKMAWSKVGTTGEKPGPRDSHSAVLVGHKMIVFGGTNGFKKVNDIHILDLLTKEWVRPICEGTPPSPRESHTATLVGDERLVIFGGSGEGDANYLNDLHILDLRTMRWTSPELKGDLPVPRDSHITLAIGNKLVVYGGDCGDKYHGDVNMLDMDSMTWSRLKIQGSSPGVRAGHAAVNIGTKVYIIGGVGDKRYYNDIWVFDTSNCSWTQLDIKGQQPQGRFSHTAVVADKDIAIYGGCGEDERPLNELLVLQLGEEHPNGRYNISMCKVFGSYWKQEKNNIPRRADVNGRTHHNRNNVEVLGKWGYEVVSERTQPCHLGSGTSQQKRRRIAAAKVLDVESEQEEHSLSLSQHSSPSQSDQEQTPGQKANASVMESHRYHLLKHINKTPSNWQHDIGSSNKRVLKNVAQTSSQDLQLLDRQLKQEQFLHIHEDRKGHIQNLVGAEVRGKVDGAFDSGLLMTATVNGRIFRGVLFAPGAGVVSTNVEPTCSLQPTQTLMNSNHVDSLRTSQQALLARPSPIMRGSTASLAKEHNKMRSDLQGLVLTLGGPSANSNHA